jgi:hypothetical protein
MRLGESNVRRAKNGIPVYGAGCSISRYNAALISSRTWHDAIAHLRLTLRDTLNISGIDEGIVQ